MNRMPGHPPIAGRSLRLRREASSGTVSFGRDSKVHVRSDAAPAFDLLIGTVSSIPASTGSVTE
jgi:hypothetical protein